MRATRTNAQLPAARCVEELIAPLPLVRPATGQAGAPEASVDCHLAAAAWCRCSL